jgi:riboflavin biosynthesis pyrimidine reductase
LVPNLDDLRQAMTEDRFGDKVVDFDDDAYSKGIYNVPTYFIGEERLAEQPYSEIQQALNTFLQQTDELTEIYRHIEFPQGVGSRPYTFINMVSTVDGKIITGERDENVSDLGSNYDHFIMHRLENKADGVLVGAGSLRASGSKWNPKTEYRVVVTESGRLDFESEFLKNGTPVVLTSEACTFPFPDSVRVIRLPGNRIDWSVAMERLFDIGIKKLNVLGGSVVNSQLIRAEVIDEIFLTIAPKIKLGEGVPTIADGEPLLRSEVKHFNLIEHHRIGSELFLRYRR